MKPKILYVGCESHLKSKSTVFLKTYLAERYDVVEVLDFSFLGEDLSQYYAIVIFQSLPEYEEFEKIKHNNILYFPMYDQSYKIPFSRLYIYKKCKFITFSKKLHEKYKKWGFDTTYLKFFPQPIETENMGDEKSVFFIERVNQITAKTIDEVIGFKNIDTLHIHKAIDWGHEFFEDFEFDNVSYSDWIEEKENLRKIIQKSAIFFAPRVYEGIGMSFLEAMAMGRCVVAVNEPTMNEYIIDGKTGYLYNFGEKIELKNIQQIQKNAQDYIKKGYEDWLVKREEIFNVIERKVKLKVPLLRKLFLYYLNPFNRYNFRFKLGKNAYIRIFGIKFGG